MPGTLVEHGIKEYNKRSYKIFIIKTSHIITRTACHIKQKPISAEQYLLGEITKVKNELQSKMTLTHYSMPVHWNMLMHITQRQTQKDG